MIFTDEQKAWLRAALCYLVDHHGGDTVIEYPDIDLAFAHADEEMEKRKVVSAEGVMVLASNKLDELISEVSKPNPTALGREQPAVGGAFRKKPVVIHAIQWWKYGDHPEVTPEPLPHLVEGRGWIKTLEGGHVVTPGEWIIQGIKGEFYPCRPDIFAETYESVGQPPAPSSDQALIEEARRLVNAIWPSKLREPFRRLTDYAERLRNIERVTPASPSDDTLINAGLIAIARRIATTPDLDGVPRVNHREDVVVITSLADLAERQARELADMKHDLTRHIDIACKEAERAEALAEQVAAQRKLLERAVKVFDTTSGRNIPVKDLEMADDLRREIEGLLK